LERLQVKVKLIEIRSHVGINEMADKLAYEYETSKKLFKGELTASPNLSVKAAFKMAHHIA